METTVNFVKSLARTDIRILAVLFTGIFLLIQTSCQKDVDDIIYQDLLKSATLDAASQEYCHPYSLETSAIYFNHIIFKRYYRAPFREVLNLENPNFACYDDTFVLKIRNGRDRRSRVSSAEIRIDGVLIVRPSDFSKNKTFIFKRFSGLQPTSVLEVRLNGSPGSYIDLWIEGSLTINTPEFEQIGPLEQYSPAPVLPTTSINGITGVWTPETINTSEAGTFTYTFTPSANQCADIVTMEIQINSIEAVTDIDGNIYKIVKIGDQVWMAENLKVTKYRNGDLIGTTTPATMDISGESEPKYQWAYNGDEGNVETYGRLYTWYTVGDSRGVCPTGWHVPSDVEWTTLTDYLTDNGYGYEGSGPDIGKSMAATTGWRTNSTPGNVGNDQASNNSSGFTAVPGGYRINTGTFTLLEFYSSWWSSTENGSAAVWFYYLFYNQANLTRNSSYKVQGGAIRCIKDN